MAVDGSAQTVGVVIELSDQQVDQVARAASAAVGATSLNTKLARARDVSKIGPRGKQGGLSQSLLAGLAVLNVFPADGTSLGNLQVARMLDMSPSTAHRYLSTLRLAGLVERDPDTRRYRLAP
jgi:DNA-binding MarR family transcriptional regulator